MGESNLRRYLIHCSPRGGILAFPARRNQLVLPSREVAVVNRKTCGRAAVKTKGHKNWERQQLRWLHVVGDGGSVAGYPCPRAGHDGYQG